MHGTTSMAGTMPRTTPAIVSAKCTATRMVTKSVPIIARKLALLSVIVASMNGKGGLQQLAGEHDAASVASAPG